MTALPSSEDIIPTHFIASTGPRSPEMTNIQRITETLEAGQEILEAIGVAIAALIAALLAIDALCLDVRRRRPAAASTPASKSYARNLAHLSYLIAAANSYVVLSREMGKPVGSSGGDNGEAGGGPPVEAKVSGARRVQVGAGVATWPGARQLHYLAT